MPIGLSSTKTPPTLTPNGPSDGGDFGPNTPGTTTSGVQEWLNAIGPSGLGYVVSGIYSMPNGATFPSNIQGLTILGGGNFVGATPAAGTIFQPSQNLTTPLFQMPATAWKGLCLMNLGFYDNNFTVGNGQSGRPTLCDFSQPGFEGSAKGVFFNCGFRAKNAANTYAADFSFGDDSIAYALHTIGNGIVRVESPTGMGCSFDGGTLTGLDWRCQQQFIRSAGLFGPLNFIGTTNKWAQLTIEDCYFDNGSYSGGTLSPIQNSGSQSVFLTLRGCHVGLTNGATTNYLCGGSGSATPLFYAKIYGDTHLNLNNSGNNSIAFSFFNPTDTNSFVQRLGVQNYTYVGTGTGTSWSWPGRFTQQTASLSNVLTYIGPSAGNNNSNYLILYCRAIVNSVTGGNVKVNVDYWDEEGTHHSGHNFLFYNNSGTTSIAPSTTDEWHAVPMTLSLLNAKNVVVSTTAQATINYDVDCYADVR